jgi:hypothetical protein
VKQAGHALDRVGERATTAITTFLRRWRYSLMDALYPGGLRTMSDKMNNRIPESHGAALDDVLAKLRNVKAAADPHARVVADITRRTTAFALTMAEQRRPEAERLAHEAVHRVRHATETVKPQLQRLAHEARPTVGRVTREAVTFIREHEEELRAGAAGIAKQRTPLPFHRVIDALTRHKKKECVDITPRALS